MSLHIKKITISNFLSFFGEHEVELKPFTTILCNFEQGKEDFFKAIQFVFGVSLSDINIENASDLINPIVNDAGDESSNKECYVEVVLQFVGRENDLQMRTAVTNERIKYRISNTTVSKRLYEEKLNSLNLNVKNKNLIFHGDDFNDVIWGTTEDLERVVVKCLREPFLVEKWEQFHREVKRLQGVEKILAERKYDIAKKNHVVIANFIKKYDDIASKQDLEHENTLEIIGRHPADEESDRNSSDTSPHSDNGSSPPVQSDTSPHSDNVSSPPVQSDTSPHSDNGSSAPVQSTQSNDEQSEQNLSTSDDLQILEAEMEEKHRKISELEAEKEELRIMYYDLKSLINISLVKLYRRDIVKARKSRNMSVLEERIKQLKEWRREEENKISIIWQDLQKAESDFDSISKCIHDNFELIHAMQYSKKLKGRLSPYGRLADHISHSRNIKLLKSIIGEDLFYANLVDTYEEATKCLKYIKKMNCEHRETFIIFDDENYHQKLKDVILTDGETGIDISDFEKLLIFLSKLKRYGLISEIPILAKRKFNPEMIEQTRDYDIIFTTDRILLRADNSISGIEIDQGIAEDEFEIMRRLNDLIKSQELKLHEINELHFLKKETLTTVQSLEDDIFFLKKHVKRTSQRDDGSQPPFFSSIYDEYQEYFEEQNKLLDEAALEAAAQFKEEKWSSTPPVPPSSSSSSQSQPYDERFEEIQNLLKELEKIREKMSSIEKEIVELSATFFCFKRFPADIWLGSTFLKDKPTMYYEKELAKLRTIMNKEDIDEFKGSREWRLSLLQSLCAHLKDIKKELKDSENTLQKVTKARKNKLIPLIGHCSQYFFYTFQEMLDGAVNFIDLAYDNSENKLKIVTSLREETINLMDFKNLATFFKFITALCLFLQIAMFEKIPLMILDNMDHFFPKNAESVNEVFSQTLVSRLMPESENLDFDLMMRIGEYLSLFRKKNTTRPPLRRNGARYVNGPSQVLYFTSSDFSLAAEHHVLINRKILPSECISENNIYFSTLQSISF